MSGQYYIRDCSSQMKHYGVPENFDYKNSCSVSVVAYGGAYTIVTPKYKMRFVTVLNRYGKQYSGEVVALFTPISDCGFIEELIKFDDLLVRICKELNIDKKEFGDLERLNLDLSYRCDNYNWISKDECHKYGAYIYKY